MPDQPLVSIAAPSFMWTTIEPEACEGGSCPDDEPSADAYPSTWHHVFGLKMADAVHRAGFRREVIDAINSPLIKVDECEHHTSPIIPAAHAAFWNPDLEAGANATTGHLAADHAVHDGKKPAIVAELTSLALSLWAHREDSLYSPWSTQTMLSPSFNQDLPAFMLYPDDPAWREVVRAIQRLRNSIAYPDGEVLNIYLTGDTWEDEMVDAFKTYLGNNEHTDLNVEFRGQFAGSDGAAFMARKILDHCTDT